MRHHLTLPVLASLVLVVALAAPVAGQQPSTVVAGPSSHEAVKKRALWTNCLGVSLSTRVTLDTDLSEESVWNVAEVALRSARIYYEDPNRGSMSRWQVMVRLWGGASAHYIAIEFFDTLAGSVIADWTLEQLADSRRGVPSDLDFLARGSYTAMTYRVEALGSGWGDPSDVLGKVRTLMDTFLVDYLRAHADCDERPERIGG